MRYRYFAGLILLVFSNLFALQTADAGQVIFLVRHAEQELDVEDPALTEAGHKRAQALAGTLKDAGVQIVYTSETRRTRQTAEPIVQALNITHEIMPRRDIEGLIHRIRTRHPNDEVLIVSHTRTIPLLLRELGYSENVSLARDEYDNLFVIVPKGKDESVVLRLRF